MLFRKVKHLLDSAPAAGGGGNNQPQSQPAPAPNQPAPAAPAGQDPPSQSGAPGSPGSSTGGNSPSEGSTAPGEGAEPSSPPAASDTPSTPDPLLAAVLRDMKGEPEINPVEEPPAEPPAAPSAPPQEPPKGAAPEPPKPGEPTPPAAPTGKRSKKRVVIVPELEAQPAPAAPPAPPAAPPPAPAPQVPPADPDEAYVSGLTDEQREELAEAEYAERLYPDQYKGRRKSLIEWYRKVDSETARLFQENPERKLDETDEDFQKVLRTKPRMSAAHAKRIQRTIGREEAVQEVKKEYEPELTEIKRKQQEIEYKPVAERIVGQFNAGVTSLVVADDQSPLAPALKIVTAEPQQEGDGWKLGDRTFATKQEAQDYKSAFKLEQKIYEEERDKAAGLTREYLMFAKGLRKYDAQNRQHVDLLNFITHQGNAFMQNGGDLLVRDGKRFLPRDQYVSLLRTNPQAAASHWTWNDRDIIDMLAFQAKANMETRVKEAEVIAREMGYERRQPGNSAIPPKSNNAPAKPEPTPITPPRAAPRAAKGPTVPTPPQAQSTGDGIDPVATLGLRRK